MKDVKPRKGRVAFPKCGAKNRQGNPCRNPSGLRTDHPGEGRCFLHGGRAPIKTGQYSSVPSRLQSYREQVEKWKINPDLKNLNRIIAEQMVAFKQIEEIVASSDVIDPAKFAGLIELLENISKNIEREARMHERQTMSFGKEDFTAIRDAFVQAVMAHTSEDVSRKIFAELQATLRPPEPVKEIVA